MSPDFAHRRISELDHVIWPAKYGDQRGCLHEQRVEQSLLEFRVFPCEALTFTKFGIGIGRSSLGFNVGVGAEPVNDVSARIAHGIHAREKSTEGPVRTAQREHHLERGS